MKSKILALLMALLILTVSLVSCDFFLGDVATEGDITVVVENAYGSYDVYKTYLEKRGLYLMLEDVFPCGVFENEDMLLAAFSSFDRERYVAVSRAFRERFAPYAGHACEKLLSALRAALQNK